MNKPPMHSSEPDRRVVQAGSAPPILRNLNAPAMIKLSLLVKLATIAARTKAAFDTMNDDELAQADSEFAFKVNDPEVAALLADMRRTGLL